MPTTARPGIAKQGSKEALRKTSLKKQTSIDVLLKNAAISERRRSSINEREAARVAGLAEQQAQERRRQKATSTKYPKRDVLFLKQIFDEYDGDGSGELTRLELRRALAQEKAAAQRYDGSKQSLAERQARVGHVKGQTAGTKGVFLLDFSDSIFRAMDYNGDERVSFAELLSVMYPLSSAAERRTMMSWACPRPVEVPVDESKLLAEEEAELRAMFRVYDKDGSGALSRGELVAAMRRCGIDEEEATELFEEVDKDGNGRIDLDEFMQMMRDSGLYSSPGLLSWD